MNNWNKGILGDFITLQRGFDLPAYDRHSGNVPVVTSSGISDFHNEAKVKAPGVAMGRYGTIGTIYFIKEDFWPHNTTLYVKDFKGNDPHFVSYFLQTINYQAHNDKSSVPGVNRNHLHLIPIVFPPLSEQRAIAGILGALDDKIEVNRRMNATLESMARAVFRQWFVEHEEAMEWEVGSVGDVIKRISVGKKYDFKTAQSEGNIPILDQSRFAVIGYHNEAPGVVATLDNPVVVFSNHRCYTDIIHFSFSAIQNVLPFVGNGVDTRWLYHATDGIIEYSEYKGHWPDFVSKPLVIPPEDLTSKFGEFVKPIHIKIMKNKEESRTLASLRDTLLPKVMRGEVRVSAL